MRLGKRFKPETAEDVKSVSTSAGMLKWIKVQGHHNPVIHAVLQIQHAMRLTDLEAMAMIAYAMTIAYEDLQDMMLDQAMRTINPIVLRPEDLKIEVKNGHIQP